MKLWNPGCIVWSDAAKLPAWNEDTFQFEWIRCNLNLDGECRAKLASREWFHGLILAVILANCRVLSKWLAMAAEAIRLRFGRIFPCKTKRKIKRKRPPDVPWHGSWWQVMPVSSVSPTEGNMHTIFVGWVSPTHCMHTGIYHWNLTRHFITQNTNTSQE